MTGIEVAWTGQRLSAVPSMPGHSAQACTNQNLPGSHNSCASSAQQPQQAQQVQQVLQHALIQQGSQRALHHLSLIHTP